MESPADIPGIIPQDALAFRPIVDKLSPAKDLVDFGFFRKSMNDCHPIYNALYRDILTSPLPVNQVENELHGGKLGRNRQNEGKRLSLTALWMRDQKAAADKVEHGNGIAAYSDEHG
jgi:hypothetical protein